MRGLPIGEILGLVGLWGLALAQAQTRNVRAILALLALSTVVLAGTLDRGPIGGALEIAGAAGAVILLLAPGPFASLTATDLAADQILRNLAVALDDSTHPEAPTVFATQIHAPPFTSPGSPWETVGRFYRVLIARHRETDAEAARPGRSPVWAYRHAGRHFWRLALDRRVIGRRHQPSEWNEDALLRSLCEEFNGLIPEAALLPEPSLPEDGWDIQAEGCIEAVAGVRLRYESSRRSRALLLEAMPAQLAVARGDRSKAAIGHANTTGRALAELWPAPIEEPRPT
jgi:hypothetical protein